MRDQKEADHPADHGEAAERGMECLARLDHERECDDRGDVRNSDLRHDHESARIGEEILLLECGKQDCRRSTGEEECVYGAVPVRRQCCDRDAGGHREHGDHDRGQEAASDAP